MPQFNSEEQLVDGSFALSNISLYLQGLYFGKIAKTAPEEAKPLLYHYAENSLFGLMINSCMKYGSFSNRHGITTKFMDDPLQTALKFELHGFFPRIVEFYSILGMNSSFSIFPHDGETETYGPTSPDPYTQFNFSIHEKPFIKLADLLALRYEHTKRRPMYMENATDVLDFVILFACSALARYRPYLWHRLIAGNDNASYATIQEAYRRYKLFQTRIELALIQGEIMRDPSQILKMHGGESLHLQDD